LEGHFPTSQWGCYNTSKDTWQFQKSSAGGRKTKAPGSHSQLGFVKTYKPKTQKSYRNYQQPKNPIGITTSAEGIGNNWAHGECKVRRKEDKTEKQQCPGGRGYVSSPLVRMMSG
jgi:hypothetical protein